LVSIDEKVLSTSHRLGNILKVCNSSLFIISSFILVQIFADGGYRGQLINTIKTNARKSLTIVIMLPQLFLNLMSL